MRALKGDWYLSDPPIPISEWIGNYIANELAKMPFTDFFASKPVLVPTPSSSLKDPGALWVPLRLANAMVRGGLGKMMLSCLQRIQPLPKSATSLAENRPKAVDHYRTIGIQKIFAEEPEEILLIDDVVTRGATLLGAANKLADVFPNAKIRAFAVMRTISVPEEFKAIISPCKGTIQLFGVDTYREP
jgi:predicted amidophosphoribosyltransferase